MTCLTLMSILRGGVRAVFAVGAERLLRRRPFPVLGLVCFFLGSILNAMSRVSFFAFSSVVASSALLGMNSLDDSV
jgi:hypothetical protein